MTIVEFLEAREAEDEAVGKRIVDGPHRGHRIHLQDILGTINRNCPDCMTIVAGKRWLAECAAKRELVARFGTMKVQDRFRYAKFEGKHGSDIRRVYLGRDEWSEWMTRADLDAFTHEHTDFDSLKTLARIHSDHPDFDQAWA